MSGERHLDVVRHVAHGRWDALRAMRPDGGGEDFALYAARHHVAHYVLARGGPALPPAWLGPLRAEVARRGEREARVPAVMAEAVGALKGAGVGCLVLKGLPFAERYYGGAALRRTLDVDLLVREADADPALRALLALGWRAPPRRLVRTPDGPAIRRHRLRTEHALPLARGDVPVDLHWRLRTAPAYRIREDDVWAGARRVRAAGVDCDVPSDEYALVLLLLSIAHDLGRCRCRLKHLLDARQLVRAADLDWPRFLAKRAEENVLGIAVNALGIVLDVLDCRDEAPRLAEALRPHAPLRVPADAVALLQRAPGGVENAFWFARVYPIAWGRDALWWIDRNLSHPGRLPISLYRGLRFGVRSIRHLVAGPRG
jgi:hypothetical protein